MKNVRNILILVLVYACIAVSCVYGAGSCTQALEKIPNSNIAVLTFTCTADGAAGTFPTITTGTDITAAIRGYSIAEVRTAPGATAPTNLYDASMNDSLGVDLMGGTLIDRSSTKFERATPLLGTGNYGPSPIDTALSLVITGTSVNSAIITFKAILRKE
jgi:hypothetical protein